MTWFSKICVYICVFIVLYVFHFLLSTSIGKLFNNVYGIDWRNYTTEEKSAYYAVRLFNTVVITIYLFIILFQNHVI